MALVSRQPPATAALQGLFLGPESASPSRHMVPRDGVKAEMLEPEPREESSGEELSRLQKKLAELIRENGDVRDDQRMAVLEHEQQQQLQADTFCADCILGEDSGFEVWLGSLEDALCLDGLRKRGINAILNCALEECERECAAFRGCGGRRRAHARGLSAMNSGFVGGTGDGPVSLDRDQVRAVALFDGEWYTSMLGLDTAFLGFSADDEDGYSMDRHFAEASEFLRQCRSEGRKVLVHCIMGINRSSAVLAAFMCSEMGLGLVPTVDVISKHRGHVLSNRSFLKQLVTEYGQAAGGHNDDTA